MLAQAWAMTAHPGVMDEQAPPRSLMPAHQCHRQPSDTQRSSAICSPNSPGMLSWGRISMQNLQPSANGIATAGGPQQGSPTIWQSAVPRTWGQQRRMVLSLHVQLICSRGFDNIVDDGTVAGGAAAIYTIDRSEDELPRAPGDETQGQPHTDMHVLLSHYLPDAAHG